MNNQWITNAFSSAVKETSKVFKFASSNGAELNQIGWGNLTWDALAIIFFIATVFAYGIILGKGRILVILSSIYMAAFLVMIFPWKFGKNFFNQIPNNLIIFTSLLFLLYLFLSRSSLASVARFSTRGSWIATFILSFFQVGLLTSIVISYFPAEKLQSLIPLIFRLFDGAMARFIWAAMPLLAIVAFKKRRRRVNY